MKIPIMIGATAIALGLAAIPGIQAVYNTTGPKFSEKPMVEVGQFSYAQTGCDYKPTERETGQMASLFREQFETPLVNDSGVRVGAGVENWSAIAEMIQRNNALNDGRGGAVTKTAEDGSKYIEYEQMDLPGIPRYIINGQIAVKCCDGTSRQQSVIITTTIIDRMTGRVVGNGRVAGTGERMQNYKMLGPKPSIWERFVSGYVREIKFDDMLENLLGQSAMEMGAKLVTIDPGISNGRAPGASGESKLTIEKNNCGDPLLPFREIIKAGAKDVNPKFVPDESASRPKDTIPVASKNPPAPATKAPQTNLLRARYFCSEYTENYGDGFKYVGVKIGVVAVDEKGNDVPGGHPAGAGGGSRACGALDETLPICMDPRTNTPSPSVSFIMEFENTPENMAAHYERFDGLKSARPCRAEDL